MYDHCECQYCQAEVHPCWQETIDKADRYDKIERYLKERNFWYGSTERLEFIQEMLREFFK